MNDLKDQPKSEPCEITRLLQGVELNLYSKNYTQLQSYITEKLGWLTSMKFTVCQPLSFFISVVGHDARLLAFNTTVANDTAVTDTAVE